MDYVDIGLWIGQTLLALGMAGAGGMKAMSPREKLLPQMKWVARFPVWAPRAIGLAEVAGAIEAVKVVAAPTAALADPGLTLTVVAIGGTSADGERLATWPQTLPVTGASVPEGSARPVTSTQVPPSRCQRRELWLVASRQIVKGPTRPPVTEISTRVA